jgi:hypothetical protein
VTSQILNRPEGDEVPLLYQGWTPVATCHWQWIANVLAIQGHPGYWERLGLAWGCRWDGGNVLFGCAKWTEVLADLTGIVVSIRTFGNEADAKSHELDLSAAGVPFIAEIDEFFLPTSDAERDHVVHAVLVIRRTADLARLVDAKLGPNVIEFAADEYDLMRAHECRGRVESYKLYVVQRGPSRDPSVAETMASVRSHLESLHPASISAHRDYIDWVRATDADIDVCRAAGERYQATQFFRHLATRDVDDAAQLTERFTQLTDDWYLVHMLATHDRAAEIGTRRRLIRLLERLVESEAAAAEAVLA